MPRPPDEEEEAAEAAPREAAAARSKRSFTTEGLGCGTAALNTVPCACLFRLHAAGVVEPQRADGVDFEERRRAARVEAGRRPVRLELGAPYQATAHNIPSEGELPS